MANDYIEFSKRLSLLPSCDVLVAGGGIAGSMAAIAAARAGANTVLMESYGFLGGTPVFYVERHFSFCGDTAYQGEIFDEFLAKLEGLGATVPYKPWDPQGVLSFSHESWDSSVARYFDPTVFQLVLQEMVLQEKNIRLLLHTRVLDATMDNSQIAGVIFHNKSGLQAIRPRVVIDCTGDAELAAAAGFPCTKGRESDKQPIPLSLCIILRDVGEPVTPVLPPWGVKYKNKHDLPRVDLLMNKDGFIHFRVKIAGYDPTEADSLTEAEVLSRRDVFSIVYYLQTHGYPTWKLDSISTQVGIRIGRRIIGEYVLTVEDVRQGAHFDDAIARGTCNLTDMNLMKESTEDQTRKEPTVEVVPAYQIPLRSLIPQGSQNMLAAGRCISADSWALSSARMIPTCAMMGQAAGIAAALCAKNAQPVTDTDIAALQKELKARGAKL